MHFVDSVALSIFTTATTNDFTSEFCRSLIDVLETLYLMDATSDNSFIFSVRYYGKVKLRSIGSADWWQSFPSFAEGTIKFFQRKTPP
jgi:hypothetical protein